MIKLVEGSRPFCHYPFHHLKFDAEGNVTMCCFQQQTFLGNILSQSLEDIWLSPLAKSIRRGIITKHLHSFCEIDGCPFSYRVNRLQSGPAIRSDYPTEFEIDLPIQHCNVGGENPTEANPACLMCNRGKPFVHQIDRLDKICVKLAPYIKHVYSLHIQGVSESFWKGRIFDILHRLEIAKHRRVYVTTTTNGTLMGKNNRSRFLEIPHSSLTWSIDAGTAETYKKIRRLDMFHKVLENLRNYGKERSPTQISKIHNTINLLNIGEVEEMVRLMSDANIDYIEFNATCGMPEICVNTSNARLFKDAQQRIIEASQRYGVKCFFLRELDLGMSSEHGW